MNHQNKSQDDRISPLNAEEKHRKNTKVSNASGPNICIRDRANLTINNLKIDAELKPLLGQSSVSPQKFFSGSHNPKIDLWNDYFLSVNRVNQSLNKPKKIYSGREICELLERQIDNTRNLLEELKKLSAEKANEFIRNANNPLNDHIFPSIIENQHQEVQFQVTSARESAGQSPAPRLTEIQHENVCPGFKLESEINDENLKTTSYPHFQRNQDWNDNDTGAYITPNMNNRNVNFVLHNDMFGNHIESQRSSIRMLGFSSIEPRKHTNFDFIWQ